MSRKRRRLTLIAVCGGVLAVALALVLVAMRDTIVFFRTPTEVAANTVAAGTRFRLGGLVKAGSVTRGADQTVAFVIEDGNASVPVRYRGLLPDLFREGQGVVTEGRLEGGAFRADSVLAKHDETYMPREVADALKKQGFWHGDKAAEKGRGPAPATASR